MPMRIQIIARNKKARHNYELLDTFEAGLELLGSEVKSLRNGRASLAEAYVKVRKGEAWLQGAHIPPYAHATHENHEPKRHRKLLLGKRELKKLHQGTNEKGLTVVPLKLYFKGPWAKVEIALGRGKKMHDKRESLKRDQDKRDMDRARRSR